MTIEVHPDSLLFHVVSTLPGTERLSELDRLVLAGLVCFASPEGEIVLNEKVRTHIREGLQLSMSGLANVILRLIGSGMIIRQSKQRLVLTSITRPLVIVPKRLEKEFEIKFVTNKQ